MKGVNKYSNIHLQF